MLKILFHLKRRLTLRLKVLAGRGADQEQKEAARKAEHIVEHHFIKMKRLG